MSSIPNLIAHIAPQPQNSMGDSEKYIADEGPLRKLTKLSAVLNMPSMNYTAGNGNFTKKLKLKLKKNWIKEEILLIGRG